MSTIKAHPVFVGGWFDFIAGVNRIGACSNAGGGGATTGTDGIDALGHDPTIGVCCERAGI